MNHLKVNPIGIDFAIQKLQVYLYDKLGYSNFNGYGRCYPIEREGKTTPNRYVGNNEYEEVLLNDNLSGHFFFTENPVSKKNTSGLLETEVSIIFLVDLSKIKPSVERTDEEVRMEIEQILWHKNTQFPITEIVRGQKVLEDFDSDNFDMQPYCFLKFKGLLKYNINDC